VSKYLLRAMKSVKRGWVHSNDILNVRQIRRHSRPLEDNGSLEAN
jgi:hypothetical protein